MSQLIFKWNSEKAESNRKKHKVSFGDAVGAFKDDFALVIHDPDHSIYEDRWVLIGMIAPMKVLTVCYHHDEETEIVRIISVRKAKPMERKQYMERRR